jgi:hypothetical protein
MPFVPTVTAELLRLPATAKVPKLMVVVPERVLVPESVKVPVDVSFTKLPAPDIAPDRVCAALEEYCSVAPLAMLMVPL